MKQNNTRDDNAIQSIKQMIKSRIVPTPEMFPEENLIDLLMEAGVDFYKSNESINALNCFNTILDIDPNNQKATTYIQMIEEVLNFFNKDLLNP